MSLQTGGVDLAEQISELPQACVMYRFAGERIGCSLRTYIDLHSCLAVGEIHLLCKHAEAELNLTKSL